MIIKKTKTYTETNKSNHSQTIKTKPKQENPLSKLTESTLYLKSQNEIRIKTN